MPRISPAARVSFGLVLFTISLLLIADLLKLIPDKQIIMQESRIAMVESLANQVSIAVSRRDKSIIHSSLENFVKRNANISYVDVDTGGIKPLSGYGVYLEKGQNMSVPIFNRGRQYGYVNVNFKPQSLGFIKDLQGSLLGMLLFTAIAGYVGYLFILRKTLRVLDPKSVVPERVRAAFNALSEGVLLMDKDENIMLANDAFAKKVNVSSDSLLGKKISSLKWKKKKTDNSLLPWEKVIEQGESSTGVTVNLENNKQEIISLSTNSAAITDDSGDLRGALLTFDDITETEKNNLLLSDAVNTLEKNEVNIRKQNQELEILASHDPLTGCYNRRAFFDYFEEVYATAIRENKQLSCIMADIDFFKSINDSYGHSIGDEALRLVANVLHACEKEGIIVGRYGGEEFGIILPGVDEVGAADVAERIRQNIQTTSLNFCAENTCITASFGVAGLGPEVATCAQMMDMSDKALYIAKESGRNKVIRWNQHGDQVQNESTTDECVKEDVDQELASSNDTDKEVFLKLEILQKKNQQLEEQLRTMQDSPVKHPVDFVTDLPSQYIFEDRIDQAIVNTQRINSLMAVAIINIDMFSRINDTLGEAVGDDFLKAVGMRLKTILRRSDTVATLTAPGQSSPSLSRLRDDEFSILLTGLDSLESLTYVIKRIQDKFSGRIDVSGNELFVTTSIGLSVFPGDGESTKDLIEKARAAQHHAKDMPGRNNCQFYSVDVNRQVINQMQAEIDLHHAITEGQLELVYQPKLDFSTGEIKSMEALIRWNHPDRGVIAPDLFIPIAEKTGLIIDIGYWCLKTACRQAKTWLGLGIDDIRVSVNISAVEFSDEDFIRTLRKILKETQLNARHLEIEITETTVMKDAEQAERIIDELRYMNIAITIDDFGTGYSSLSYLGKLDFDWLKIDRTFLLEAFTNQRSKTLYSGIVGIAHSMGFKVVSEGIETQQHYDFVKKLKVNEIQGYILSKPIHHGEMTEMLLSEQQSEKRMKLLNLVSREDVLQAAHKRLH